MDNKPGRVVQGAGIYHTPKVQYSPETKQFLKELMEESRLTTMQRKKVNYSLRSGDPLPSLSQRTRRESSIPRVIIKPELPPRRTLDKIRDSGAYEREKFIPMNPRISRDMAKRHLQDIMTYGKDVPDLPARPKKREMDSQFQNRYEELKNEIQEREEWFADMERLGEGYKYKQLIEQQIAARINEMEQLKLADPSINTSENTKENDKGKSGNQQTFN